MPVLKPQQIIDDLKHNYGEIAENFSKTRSKPWPAFRFFAKYVQDGSKVLDLGCGNGRLYDYLRQKAKIDYTGVDFCSEFLKIARKNHPRQDFIEQDLTELDIPGRFDLIISVASFHHIPTRKLRKKTLKRIFDQLEDDGMLLMSVWNLWQWKYWRCFVKAAWSWISSGLRWDPRDLYVPFGKKKVPRYYHAFLPFELKRLLNQAGFQVEKFESANHNFLYACRKRMASTRANPLAVSAKKLRAQLNPPSPVATYKKHS